MLALENLIYLVKVGLDRLSNIRWSLRHSIIGVLFLVGKGIYIVIWRNFCMEPFLEEFDFIFYLIIYVI